MLSLQDPSENHPQRRRLNLQRCVRASWLGQTAASLCWIVSVFSYGISEAGDWLQLIAASCWLLSNIAVVLARDVERKGI